MASQVESYLAPKVRRITTLSFPQPRAGPAPETRKVIPHQQLDQWPPGEIVDQLWSRSLGISDVYPRQSRMASPETLALCLPDELALGPSAAFIDGSEFCHLHPPPEGSVHLTLPAPVRELIIQLGWAEEHPMARSGYVSALLVMVFAPRTAKELTVVTQLVRISRDFAGGGF